MIASIIVKQLARITVLKIGTRWNVTMLGNVLAGQMGGNWVLAGN